eukprot:g3962.t1
MVRPLACLFFFCGLACCAASSAAPVKLIIDTDIGGGGCNDVDDVIAVSVGHALMDNGEAELVAIVVNTAPVRCPGAVSVLNHYYGRDELPVGVYNVSTEGATLQMQDPLPYVNVITDGFPSPIKNSSQAEDAVALYRKTLAAQPARSVAISSIGIHTNLAALLRSEPDAHSPLGGVELVREKVKLLAVMGGAYPSGTECNLCGGGSNQHNHLVASAASSYVAANWPTESSIIWSGSEVGFQVQSGGANYQKCKAADGSPVKAAMLSFEGGPDKSRYSWDPLTTLVAVRGAAAGSCSEAGAPLGANVINPTTGANGWIPSGSPRAGNQSYLVLHDAKAAGDALDQLLCQGPKKRRR